MSSQLFKDLMEGLAEVAEMENKPELANKIRNEANGLLTESFHSTEDLTFRELRDAPVGSVISLKIPAWQGKLVNGENAYKKIDDETFVVLGEDGKPDESFREQSITDVYYGILDLDEMSEYQIEEPTIKYVIVDRNGKKRSSPNEDDQELWDRVESMDPRGDKGLMVVVYDDSLDEKLVKKGSKWQAQSEKGRNFGTYDTKGEAQERLKQMEMFKHMNEGVDPEDIGYNDWWDFYDLEELEEITDELSLCEFDGKYYIADMVNGELIEGPIDSLEDAKALANDTRAYFTESFKLNGSNKSLNEDRKSDIEATLLDDEPTFAEYMQDRYGIDIYDDEIAENPDVEDHYLNEYESYLDHLYDLPETNPEKGPELDVDLDFDSDYEVNPDDFLQAYELTRDMSEEEAWDTISQRFDNEKDLGMWDEETVSDAKKEVFDFWKEIKLNEDFDPDEHTKTCPECLGDLTFVGYQGNVAEFRCDDCGSYYYMGPDSDELISSDELDKKHLTEATNNLYHFKITGPVRKQRGWSTDDEPTVFVTGICDELKGSRGFRDGTHEFFESDLERVGAKIGDTIACRVDWETDYDGHLELEVDVVKKVNESLNEAAVDQWFIVKTPNGRTKDGQTKWYISVQRNGARTKFDQSNVPTEVTTWGAHNERIVRVGRDQLMGIFDSKDQATQVAKSIINANDNFFSDLNESLDEAVPRKNIKAELFYNGSNTPDDTIYFRTVKEAKQSCDAKIEEDAEIGLSKIIVRYNYSEGFINTWSNDRGWLYDWSNKALDEAIKPLSNYSSYRLAKLLTDKYYDLTFGHEDKTPFLNWFDRNFGANNRADAANIISKFDISTEKRVNRDDLFYVRKYVDRVANLLISSTTTESLNESQANEKKVFKQALAILKERHPNMGKDNLDIKTYPNISASIYAAGERICGILNNNPEDLADRIEKACNDKIGSNYLDGDFSAYLHSRFSSSTLKEAKNETLNQALWDENGELKPEVREKLELIVDKFIDALKADNVDLDVADVQIVGSNANYNYTPYSDIDLHIFYDPKSIVFDDEG